MWTGDNTARWEHLRASVPMLLSSSVAGLSFAGADVGGFFGNPDPELLVRWYAAGSMQPFFRGHSHIDTRRREPWLFGDEVTAQLRALVRARYALLPYWYTLFYEAHTSGMPVMRPLWVEFPADASVLRDEATWLVGSALLVAPVFFPGVNAVDVAFPGPASLRWFDVASRAVHAGGSRATVAAPLGSQPLFQRGGSVVPRQMRPRRAASLMARDPYTLSVALDAAGGASGAVYLDDGSSFNYQRGGFRLRALRFETEAGGRRARLTNRQAAGTKAWAPDNTVERVEVWGLTRAPTAVAALEGADDALSRAVDFTFDEATHALVLRRPDVKIAYDWTLEIDF
jgi:alpha 1,3-glucosidase